MDDPTTDIEGMRRRLERRLSELTDRLGRIATDLRSARDDDFAEHASESENDEVLEGLQAAEREEVVLLQAALARIRAGVYGTCVACGAAIPAARLDALPHALRCAPCAARAA